MSGKSECDRNTGLLKSGDLVVVQKQSYAMEGDIVVAYVEGEGNTLKRFHKDEKGKRVILHPENDKYQMSSLKPHGNFQKQAEKAGKKQKKPAGCGNLRKESEK